MKHQGHAHALSRTALARARRALEMVVLFVGAPLLMYFNLLPGWKIYWLGGFALICILWLYFDPGFDNHRFFNGGQASGSGQGSPWYRHPYLRIVLLRTLLVSVAIFFLSVLLVPDGLLAFPRHRPRLWLMIMLLYPLLSAFPQEVAFRAFFFHRYACLFRSPWVLVCCNAVAFSFLHVIYDNVWAVLLTLPMGFFLARTYALTNSLMLVSLEHGLYGCLSFTLGLGRFFYEGRN